MFSEEVIWPALFGGLLAMFMGYVLSHRTRLFVCEEDGHWTQGSEVPVCPTCGMAMRLVDKEDALVQLPFWQHRRFYARFSWRYLDGRYHLRLELHTLTGQLVFAHQSVHEEMETEQYGTLEARTVVNGKTYSRFSVPFQVHQGSLRIMAPKYWIVTIRQDGTLGLQEEIASLLEQLEEQQGE